jgi:exonuclease III
MKLISWNCQGMGNPRTVRAFKKLISNHQPDLCFLMETKLMNNQYHFLNSFKDTYSAHIVNCSVSGGGRAGGLAIIWNKCSLDMDIKSFDFNYIDMFGGLLASMATVKPLISFLLVN